MISFFQKCIFAYISKQLQFTVRIITQRVRCVSPCTYTMAKEFLHFMLFSLERRYNKSIRVAQRTVAFRHSQRPYKSRIHGRGHERWCDTYQRWLRRPGDLLLRFLQKMPFSFQKLVDYRFMQTSIIYIRHFPYIFVCVIVIYFTSMRKLICLYYLLYVHINFVCIFKA